VSLDITIDELPRLGVHGNGAGAVDHAIADDGLRVDSWEGLGGFGC
jgi:hypothetical protein